MKPKVLSIILIFSLALNLAVFGTFIFRKIDSPSRADGPPFRMDRFPFENGMGLNEDQQKEMFGLMHEFRMINDENRRMIFELEDQLFKTMRSTNPDSLEIEKLINKIGKLRITQSKQAIRHFRKINKFLSPEQQEHFHHMIMERPARHGKRFRGWREGRSMGKNKRRTFQADSTKNEE